MNVASGNQTTFHKECHLGRPYIAYRHAGSKCLPRQERSGKSSFELVVDKKMTEKTLEKNRPIQSRDFFWSREITSVLLSVCMEFFSGTAYGKLLTF